MGKTQRLHASEHGNFPNVLSANCFIIRTEHDIEIEYAFNLTTLSPSGFLKRQSCLLFIQEFPRPPPPEGGRMSHPFQKQRRDFNSLACNQDNILISLPQRLSTSIYTLHYFPILLNLNLKTTVLRTSLTQKPT